MNTPIYITGMGMNCALGLSSSQIHAALRASTVGISDIEILQTRHRGTFPVGEIKKTTPELRQMVGGPGVDTLNRTSLLAALAVDQAVEQSGGVHLHTDRVGLFSGTTVGGMDTTEDGFEDYLEQRTYPENFLEMNDCGYCAEYLADRIGNISFLTTTTTACSSSLNSIGAALSMLRSGRIDVAIAGGADALCRFTINGFNSFLLLDENPCRPFDASRSGINLGEGAAFFVLETAASLEKSGNTPLAVIRGFGNHNDTYHPTGISEQGKGIQLGMESALRDAGLGNQQIDYILTHGTGTRNNDSSEGMAIQTTFGEDAPAYASLKSSFGHTLGASGAINVGVAITAIQSGMIYANRNFTQSMPELTIDPVAVNHTEGKLQNVLINASGMGGFCSSLILSKS